MRTWIVRALVACCAVGLVAALAACGSTSSASSGSTSASGGSSSDASSDGGAAVFAAAGREIANLSKIQPAEPLPPLSGKVPAGKTVAVINCTLPTCTPAADTAPFKALGWHLKLFPFDLTKGPSDAIRALNAAIATHPDYILFKDLFPMPPFAPSLAEAAKQHIPVVQVAGNSGTANTIGCVNCQPEYIRVGRVLTDMALADAGTKTGIAFVCDQNYIPLQQLNAGFEEAAAEAKSTGTTFTKVNVDITQPPGQTAQTVVDFLQRNPSTKYVIACIPETALALPQAIAQAGLSNKVKLIYASPEPAQLDAIKAGQLFGAVAEESAASHWRAADLLARLAVGDKIPQALRDPVGWIQVVDQQNADHIAPSLDPPDYQQTFEKVWGVS
jgi:ABC-type sugar transport system substrate-binding protein